MPTDDDTKDPNAVTDTATATPPTPLDPERADLLAALSTARSALTGTVRGLTDEQLGQRPTASTLCLGGLVKHVAAMEQSWLRFVVEGPSAMSFALPDGVTWADITAGTAREVPQWLVEHEAGFRMLPGDTLAGILDHYAQVAARTEETVAAVADLSTTHPLPSAPWHEVTGVLSVRGVLMHVIAETAQHAGHADILRESLDGQRAT
ncbi:DinB family protein [Micromonospora sp. NPDC048868]|uniref:DinB family protein n=1 Tax=Micromonospora sp. NPDC048868 TaxID=3364258 RepID=UPI00371B0C02